ncbi:MAG: DUF4390 domain-containing protein [Deltaproteobacteria bacterium]|nr:DUF4390 domain-containing protein [Deltaproteobacteria bacterium]
MRVLIAFIALSLPALLPAGTLARPPVPVISEVSGTIRGGEARVRFTLRNAFTPEMVEALKSGIEITFKTNVEVERVYRNWFNRPMGHVEYTRSVRYNALSRVYRLHSDDGDELLPDVLAALDRMTRFEVAVPVTGDVEKGKHYRALVRARLDKVGLSEPLRSIFFFSSLWDVETDWSRGDLKAP